MQQTQNQQDRLNYSFSRPIIVIWFHLQIRAPSALAERGHMSESSSRAETIRLDRGLITSNVIRREERRGAETRWRQCCDAETRGRRERMLPLLNIWLDFKLFFLLATDSSGRHPASHCTYCPNMCWIKPFKSFKSWNWTWIPEDGAEHKQEAQSGWIWSSQCVWHFIALHL